MLIPDIATLIEVIPTAAGTEYSTILPFLIQAEAIVKNDLLGKDCFNYIAAITDPAEMQQTLCQLVANKAYSLSIPYVDLIQTPNGFGVVSNSNQAPASKERVERLIQSCNAAVNAAIDLLFELIRQTPDALTEWAKCRKYEQLTNCLFITGIDYAMYADTDGTRGDFLKAKSTLLLAQKNELPEVLSVAYVAELLQANRDNTLVAPHIEVVETCKLALAAYAANNEDEAEELLENLIVAIEDDIDSYTTYKDSREYRLKYEVKYANQQTDPTFFFGM